MMNVVLAWIDTVSDILFVISLTVAGSCLSEALVYIANETAYMAILVLYCVGIVIGLGMRGYTSAMLAKAVAYREEHKYNWRQAIHYTLETSSVKLVNDAGGFTEDLLGFIAGYILTFTLGIPPFTFVTTGQYTDEDIERSMVTGEELMAPLEFQFNLAVFNFNMSL